MTYMKIAILSDTHGLLRQEVMDVLHQCDVIIHAGDIDSPEIKEQLEKEAPLYVVRGNSDREWAAYLPSSLHFQLGGIRFYMTHNKKRVPEDLAGIDVIIYGHSHKYSLEMRGEQLWLNPGSCGKARFTLPLTMAVMVVEEGQYDVKRVDFDRKDNRVINTPSEEDIYTAIMHIMKGIQKGEKIELIARKWNLDEKFVEEICRIILTHPGIEMDGILNRVETRQLNRNPPTSL